MTSFSIPNNINLSNFSDEELGYIFRTLSTGSEMPETAPYKVYQLYLYIYNYNNPNKGYITPSNPPTGEAERWEEPTLETITALFTEAGRPDLAEGFYRYYCRKHWVTKYGKRITDLAQAVSKWIARQFQKTPTSSQEPQKDSVKADSNNSTSAPKTTPNKPQRKPRQTKKPGQNFHNFAQRNIDYDALLKQRKEAQRHVQD